MFILLYTLRKDAIQYTVIFYRCKNDYFQMKNCDVFHIFAQNMDRWYTSEAVLTNTHNLCFRAKIRNIVYACKPQVYYIAWGVRGIHLHGRIIMMAQMCYCYII